MVGTRFGPGALAQDGTPPAEEEFELPEGVSFEALGYGTAEELPATPADVLLFRVGFEPGAGLEDDPGARLALVYVEEGVLTVTMEGPMTVLRAAAEGTPFPMETETFAAGEEFTMAEGDSAIFPAGVAGEVRNEGDEPATVLVADIGPLEGEAAGTPEAGGTPGAADAATGSAVEIADFAFSPETLTVAAGTTVTWTNDGEKPHTATHAGGAFDSGRLEPGDDHRETFDEPGTYEYFCAIHPTMTGAIVVE